MSEPLCRKELENQAKLVPERTCQNISAPSDGFLCSACGWGDFAEPSHLLKTANYCPNCGARIVKRW